MTKASYNNMVIEKVIPAMKEKWPPGTTASTFSENTVKCGCVRRLKSTEYQMYADRKQ